MRHRSFRVLVSLCFLLLLGVGAQGQEYKRPKPAVNDTTPPTNADLAAYNGVSESITVLLMNATRTTSYLRIFPGHLVYRFHNEQYDMTANASNANK
jgi:hypothetical protein